MINKKSLVILVALLPLASLTRLVSGQEDKPYFSDAMKAEQWFVSHLDTVKTWNPQEKLGVAEYLIFVHGEQLDGKATLQNEIDNILSSIENLSYEKKENKNLVLRACMLRLKISNGFDSKYKTILHKLTQLDSNNGVVWMIHAEYKFFLSDPGYKYAQDCEKALKCKQFSFYNKYSKKHMLIALEKAKLANKKILHMLILRVKAYSIAERHLPVLLYCKIFAKTDTQRITSCYAVRKYLSFLHSSGGIEKNDLWYRIVHSTFLSSVRPEIAESENWKELMKKERKYLREETLFLSDQYPAKEKLAKKGTYEDCRNYIMNDNQWRKKHGLSHKRKYSLKDWQELWQQYDDVAVKIIKQIKEKEDSEYFGPGMGMGTKIGPPGLIKDN